MIVLTSEAVAVLHRQHERQAAREDRMRNALEILADYAPKSAYRRDVMERFVRATAREGLGRDDS